MPVATLRPPVPQVPPILRQQAPGLSLISANPVLDGFQRQQDRQFQMDERRHAQEERERARGLRAIQARAAGARAQGDDPFWRENYQARLAQEGYGAEAMASMDADDRVAQETRDRLDQAMRQAITLGAAGQGEAAIALFETAGGRVTPELRSALTTPSAATVLKMAGDAGLGDDPERLRAFVAAYQRTRDPLAALREVGAPDNPIDTVLGGGGAVPGMPTGGASTEAAIGGASVVGSDYANAIATAENGTGDPAARNPNSTAMGDGQFLDATWLQVMRRHGQGFIQPGMSDQDILDLRRDPEISRAMIDGYARDNTEFLTQRGLPAGPAEQSLAHFLGPSGAGTVLSSPPETRLVNILPPHVIQANPFLRSRTAGQLRRWAADRVAAGDSITPTVTQGSAEGSAADQGGGLPAGLTPQRVTLLRELARHDPEGALKEMIALTKPHDAPSSVREYEYARGQGFQGSYTDFLDARRASGTTVNIPPTTGLPDGYAWTQREDGGWEPSQIPGLPSVSDEENARLRDQNAKITRVIGLLDQVRPDVQEGTGFYANAASLANAAASILTMEAFPETTDARNAIRTFNQLAKEALVNNPRFPVAEQQLVQRLLPDPDAIFTTPEAEFRKLSQLRDVLTRVQGLNAESLGQAPTPEPSDPAIGATDTGAGTADTPARPTTQAEYDALPSGAVFIDPDDGTLLRKP